jgi:hypothetical protein
MLAEFVGALGAQIKAAQAPTFHVHPSFPAQVFQCVGGEVKPLDVPPVRRAHTIKGLGDLVALLKDAEIAPAPDVYHSDGCVTVLLDRASRHATARMPLERTGRFAMLAGLAVKPVSLDSKGALKFLRQTIGDAAPQAVLAALRRIDFTRTSTGKAHVDHGKESLGRSVEAAVQQADQVPESFKVRVPVYGNPGLRGVQADITVGVYLNLDDEVIEFFVLPDDVESAIQQAQAALQEALAASGAPVFYGAP